jgi:hypothetical protein
VVDLKFPRLSGWLDRNFKSKTTLEIINLLVSL